MPATKQQKAEEVAGRLLASWDLVDAAQACELLRIETEDPEGVVRSVSSRNEIIVVANKGELVLPCFQFDIVEGKVFEIIHRILKVRPRDMSDLRLCYWLTRVHSEFGYAPAIQIGKDDQAILAAFIRYIEPDRHG